VIRLDPHVHTAGSYDSAASVHAVLERAAERGLDGVVITDHDAIEESLRAAALAPEYGLLGIPGVEVSTADGHLLAIGVDHRPEPGRSLAESVETVREDGGAAVVPHPFQRTRHGARAADIVDCDGIETYNALAMTGVRNRRARRFADREGHPHLAGSDAHRPDMVGRAYTAVDVEARGNPATVAPGEVIDAIRRGRTAPRGERAPVRRYVSKFARNAGIRTGAGLGRVRRLRKLL
jgi:predicted metal-dependent phosphoesterase TrpH